LVDYTQKFNFNIEYLLSVRVMTNNYNNILFDKLISIIIAIK